MKEQYLRFAATMLYIHFFSFRFCLSKKGNSNELVSETVASTAHRMRRQMLFKFAEDRIQHGYFGAIPITNNGRVP